MELIVLMENLKCIKKQVDEDMINSTDLRQMRLHQERSNELLEEIHALQKAIKILVKYETKNR